VRGRARPRISVGACGTAVLLAVLVVAAWVAGAALAAGVLAAAAVALAVRMVWECGLAARALADALARELVPDR